MAISSCRICRKEFYVKPNHLIKGWGKFCSKKCQAKSQLKGQSLSCFICNTEVYKTPKQLTKSKSGKYFCSRSCQTKWRNQVFSGERNFNWKDGKSIYRKILLTNGVVPSCFLCKVSDVRVLNAHHKDHDRAHNSSDNLVWLCLNCHYLVHHSGELDEKMRK